MAKAAKVSEATIKNIERGAADARASTLHDIQDVSGAAGVEFIEPGAASISGGPGVRLAARKAWDRVE